MKTPIIIINVKTYEESTGKKALEIAQAAEKVAQKEKAEIAIAVQATDITMISQKVKLPIMAQHIDNKTYGSNTGFLIPEAAKQAGAVGTILNHAEHQIDEKTIEETIKKAQKLGMFVCLCANTPQRGAELAKYNPEFIAVEPPELIGGDISVSNAQPGIVVDAVKLIKKANPKIKVLVGAGVKTGADVKKSLELGAEGVLLASGVVKAADKEKTITDLAKGLK